jgi:hypothetical protein
VVHGGPAAYPTTAFWLINKNRAVCYLDIVWPNNIRDMHGSSLTEYSLHPMLDDVLEYLMQTNVEGKKPKCLLRSRERCIEKKVYYK